MFYYEYLYESKVICVNNFCYKTSSMENWKIILPRKENDYPFMLDLVFNLPDSLENCTTARRVDAYFSADNLKNMPQVLELFLQTNYLVLGLFKNSFPR
jgi:hypothetical protein